MWVEGFQSTIMGILFVKKPMELNKSDSEEQVSPCWCCEFFSINYNGGRHPNNTTFRSRYDRSEFLVMSFELMNVSIVLMELMNRVFKKLLCSQMTP